MAKRARADVGGYRGVFGPRTGPTIWLSGFVSGRAFRVAQTELERLYRDVYGHPPRRLTKTDVVEFLLMGEPLARYRLQVLKEQTEEGGAA